MKNIHPIHLRKEVLHTLEVRYSKKGKWVRVRPGLIKSKPKKIFYQGREGEVKYTFKSSKNLFIKSKRKFKFIRLDKQEIFKVGRKRKGVNRVKLERFFNKERTIKLSPILERVFEVRKWAAAKGLSVGGFPLPDEKIVRRLSPKPNPAGELKPNLTEIVEGRPYELRRDFLLDLGLGELWGDVYDGQDEAEVWIGFYTTNPFREYKGDGPRFYVGKKYLTLDKAGIEQIEGVKNLEKLNAYVFDSYGELSGTEQPLFPLGIVGVRYVG